ncbi:tannase/feruloyl esterase family alpha/beta hydrolase [Haliea sp.]|jgi:pimeloyl-ACP methyl ester carboxylesterase|uniref:tannase/feruloyl esterase family alpha/beta hydrolase n=1 Tax=Haliea sp. TaxID=1932666 RepID=UPI002580AD7E|nr:tannase/feruloyl esterase family alpha/beta hydrolase [Haliea sp.]
MIDSSTRKPFAIKSPQRKATLFLHSFLLAIATTSCGVSQGPHTSDSYRSIAPEGDSSLTSSGESISTAPETTCSDLVAIDHSRFTLTASEIIETPLRHCKATGLVDDDIGIVLWLPEDWNGKFMMGGNGGLAGKLYSQAIELGALNKGYAIAGTDTGHTGTTFGGRWALYNSRAIENYAHKAVHEVTAVSKDLLVEYYGKKTQRSYFAGCSNGGRMGLMAAQRYPEDYDGIIVGAPGVDYRGVIAQLLHITSKAFADLEALESPILEPKHINVLSDAVLKQCDAIDGIEDKIISHPDLCKFDPSTLACSNSEVDGCLTDQHLSLLEAIYQPPTFIKESEDTRIPVGSEHMHPQWPMWLTGGEGVSIDSKPTGAAALSMEVMKYFVKKDPNWSLKGYNFDSFDSDFSEFTELLNADDPDLSDYIGGGGKLLMYHGWADPILSAYMSIEYVDNVYKAVPSARDDVRLFLMPGVNHCRGGMGPSQVDFVKVLDDWVEGSTNAPGELTVSFENSSAARKLCAHPLRAVYEGSNPNIPDSYQCK